MSYSSCCISQDELHGDSVFKDGQRVWSSQDSVVVLPHYSDAEGLIDDLYIVAQNGLIGSPIHEVDVFMRDFIAHLIEISDLREENRILSKTTPL